MINLVNQKRLKIIPNATSCAALIQKSGGKTVGF
jgi:hypothetical protein